MFNFYKQIVINLNIPMGLLSYSLLGLHFNYFITIGINKLRKFITNELSGRNKNVISILFSIGYKDKVILDSIYPFIMGRVYGHPLTKWVPKNSKWGYRFIKIKTATVVYQYVEYLCSKDLSLT